MRFVAGLLAIVLVSSIFISILSATANESGINVKATMSNGGKITLRVSNTSDSTEIYSLIIATDDLTKARTSKTWKAEINHNDGYAILSTTETPIKKGSPQKFYLFTNTTENFVTLKWEAYNSEKKELDNGSLSFPNKLIETTGWVKPISKTTASNNINSKYGDKYPTPKTDNGDSLTQFGYLWDKDPITISIIITENMQREDKEYKFATLIKEAIAEWQYKLRKASGRENAWGFDIKVFYEGKDKLPKNGTDITILVTSGNYLEYLGYSPCYTPAYFKYLKEQGEKEKYSNTYGKRGEEIRSKEDLKKAYAEFHEKYQHGTIGRCEISLEVYLAQYVPTGDGYAIVPAGKLSPLGYKEVSKHEFGHALGLGHTIDAPLSFTNLDIMSDGYQWNNIGWNPNAITEHYISQQDIDALLTIYGNDGFGGKNNTNHPLKDPCILTINC